MNDAQNLIDHAAQQSDRWLFLSVLLLFVLGIIFIWRWIVADRDKVSTRLTQMTDRHIEVTEKLSEVVANNTAVLHEVRKKL